MLRTHRKRHRPCFVQHYQSQISSSKFLKKRSAAKSKTLSVLRDLLYGLDRYKPEDKMPKQRRKQQVTDTNKGESTHSHEADSRGLKVSEWIALSAFSLSI